MDDTALIITYVFTFPGGREEVFEVKLDPKTIESLEPLPDQLPDWTRLEFHKCAHCPLDADTHPHCPMAARIAGIVDRFTKIISYQEIQVAVKTPERIVLKETTAQVGLSGLLGLVMATSSCPITALFRPMAAFHLPIATSDETAYRAASMYFLAQYFIYRETGRTDLNFRGLEAFYRSIEVLNEHMAQRIRGAVEKDAAINAMVELDFFAKNFTIGVEERLDEMRHLFQPFIDRFR